MAWITVPKGADRRRNRPTALMRKDWYRVQAKASSKTAGVWIFDEIGFWGTTAADFCQEFSALDATDITLHLNSPGGDVFDGIAIANAIRDHSATVTVTVDAVAASIASVIAMAGDRVIMNANSQMMIHDASGMCWGNAADMMETASILNRLSDSIASAYAGRAGGTTEMWREQMRAETWFDAQEAVDAGLADEVTQKADEAASKAAACWELGPPVTTLRPAALAGHAGGNVDTNFTGHPGSAHPGGSVSDGGPGSGRTSTEKNGAITPQQQRDNDALRMKGILRGPQAF